MSMSTTTLPRLAADSIERPDLELEGRVRRILDALIAAREAEARRQVRRFLAALSDERLSALGLSSAEVRAVRNGADVDEVVQQRRRG
jgi:uncharacterized protein YjiS (DUF1127 family)